MRTLSPSSERATIVPFNGDFPPWLVDEASIATIAQSTSPIPIQEIGRQTKLQLHFNTQRQNQKKEGRRRDVVFPLLNDNTEQVAGGEKTIYTAVSNTHAPHIAIKEFTCKMSEEEFLEYQKRFARCHTYFSSCPAVHELPHKFGELGDGTHLEFQYWLALQEDPFMLRTTYTERTKRILPWKYQQLNRVLLENTADKNAETEELLTWIDSGETYYLIEEMRRDSDFRSQIKLFIETAIDFVKQTGEILDFIGNKNFCVMKNAKGNWQCVPIDPIFVMPGQYADCIESIRRFNRGEQMSYHMWSSILNTTSCVRFLNAMAQLTGSERRLYLLPPDLQVDYRRLLIALQEWDKPDPRGSIDRPTPRPAA